jgi:hypothetical protein
MDKDKDKDKDKKKKSAFAGVVAPAPASSPGFDFERLERVISTAVGSSPTVLRLEDDDETIANESQVLAELKCLDEALLGQWDGT